MRSLRKSTETRMAAELEAVKAARDAALATIAAQAKAQARAQAQVRIQTELITVDETAYTADRPSEPRSSVVEAKAFR